MAGRLSESSLPQPPTNLVYALDDWSAATLRKGLHPEGYRTITADVGIIYVTLLS